MRPFKFTELKNINELSNDDSQSWLINAEGSIDFLRLNSESDEIVIYASGSTAKDNAQRVIELAVLKKWQSVRLSGSLAFVEAAMMNARAAGLEVTPIDDEQRELWKRIQATAKAETVEQVNANAAPVALNLSSLG